MKFLKNVFLFFIALQLFLSCKKDKDPVSTPPSQFSGKYEGKFGTGNNNPSSFYSFNIKEDGTLQEISNTGTLIGTGNWTLNGNNFRGSYHYVFPATSFFAVSGIYDPHSKKIIGTWGYGSNDKDGGMWYMTKK